MLAMQAGANGSSATPLAAMARCRGVADPVLRARCYDAAWDGFEAARARKEIVVLGQEEVKQTQRGLFGFGGLRVPFINSGDAPETLESTVARADEIAGSRIQFALADGAVWETTEPLRGGIGPRDGTAVRISRGAIGNYLVRFGRSSAGVRVRRLR